MQSIVRYLNNRAVVLAIHIRSGQESTARKLQATLAHDFPQLAVVVRTIVPIR